MGFLFLYLRHFYLSCILLIIKEGTISWSQRRIVFALTWNHIWRADIKTTVGSTVLVRWRIIHHSKLLLSFSSIFSTVPTAFRALITILTPALLTWILTDAYIYIICCHGRDQRYQPTSLCLSICMCPRWVLWELINLPKWFHTHWYFVLFTPLLLFCLSQYSQTALYKHWCLVRFHLRGIGSFFVWSRASYNRVRNFYHRLSSLFLYVEWWDLFFQSWRLVEHTTHLTSIQLFCFLTLWHFELYISPPLPTYSRLLYGRWTLWRLFHFFNLDHRWWFQLLILLWHSLLDVLRTFINFLQIHVVRFDYIVDERSDWLICVDIGLGGITRVGRITLTCLNQISLSRL